MSRFAPVFIVGCPRSGTTLLQNLLSAHPDVAIAPETHFIRRFWSRRTRNGDLDVGVNYSRVVEQIIAMPEFREMGLDSNAFREVTREGSRTYAELFRKLLILYGQSRSARIVGEKTPNHLFHMETLVRFFPWARFIHVIRDPRAVVNSWRDVPWSTGTLNGDAGLWRQYAIMARRQIQRTSLRVHTVRFEDMLGDPQPTFQKLSDFIGIALEPCELDDRRLNASSDLNIVREPWKRKTLDALDPGRKNAWRHELSSAMIAAVEAATWPEITRVGYVRDFGLLNLAPRIAKRVLDGIVRWTKPYKERK